MVRAGFLRILVSAAVRLLFNGEAHIGDGAEGAHAALLHRAQRARQRRENPAAVQRAARGQHERHRRGAQGGEAEAVLLLARAPLALLLLVQKPREGVRAPLLAPFGAQVTEHDPSEEDSVERHHYDDVQIRVTVAPTGQGDSVGLLRRKRGGVARQLHYYERNGYL